MRRVASVGAVTAWVVCGCAQGTTTTPRGALPGAGAAAVVTAAARREPLATVLEAVGTARANESVDVTSKTSNIVTSIAFREGAAIRRGQTLVELDATEARAALAEAEAALFDSESQFRRSRTLYAQQALSISQLEQIEARLKASQARVDAARARIADTVVRAGFSGRAGLRRVSVGSLVNPGTVITTLDDASVIKLEFTVPETAAHLLRTGQRLTATSAGQPEVPFAGRITTLDSRVDPATRSLAVIAEIPNADGRLRPGMFLSIALEFDPVPAVLVPESAVVPEQGHAYVFVAGDGKAQKREIRTGRRRRGEVEILAGLAGDERVVVEGTQMLRDGDSISEAPATPGIAAAP